MASNSENDMAERAIQRGWLLVWIEDVLSWIAQAALGLLVVLVVVQVITRYFLGQPFGDVITLTESYLMPGLVFLSLAVVQRRGGHIHVDLIISRFNESTRRVVNAFVFLVSAIYWLVIAYGGTLETVFSWRMGYEISRNFPVAEFTALVIVPVGAFVIALRLLALMFRPRMT